MVVTPRGLVRFWADFRSQDRPPSRSDLGPELAEDEECTMLLSLQPQGFLIGTSAGAVHQVKFFEHQWELKFRTLQGTQSSLITDTMKMLTFGFGTTQTPSANETVKAMVRAPQEGTEPMQQPARVFVLTSSRLQCWSISFDQELLKYNISLLDQLPKEEEVELLDLKYLRPGALLLLSASRKDRGQIIYKLHEVEVNTSGCS